MFPKKFHSSMKNGFTLLELIVVVMIISLMSFLLFSAAIRNEKKKVEILDARNLPETLRTSFKGQGEVEFFCIDKCRACYVIQEGEISPYEGDINLGKDLEVHILDEDNRFTHIDEFGRIEDKKICLRFHLYDNGSTTKMVIVNNLGIYYLPSYFGKPKEVKSMEEAKELWVKEEYSLRDLGSFY